MAKTAVGLFKDNSVVAAVVKALESGGFPGKDIRVVGEPLDLPTSGALSIPRTDFEIILGKDLAAMGVSDAHVAGYVDAVRQGEFLVLATGDGDKADGALAIMNANGATGVEEVAGGSAGLPSPEHAPAVPLRDKSMMTGRSVSRTSGAQLFVW